jgi:low affinity Fe/Cu permease
MLHPIFSTVLGHPELIVDHAANYAALVKQEAAEAGRDLVVRIVATVLAVASAILALGLIGVAAMLGMLHGSFHWVLVIVPGIAVLIALVSVYVASRPAEFRAFTDLQAQLDADVRALHLAGKRHGG